MGFRHAASPRIRKNPQNRYNRQSPLSAEEELPNLERSVGNALRGVPDVGKRLFPIRGTPRRAFPTDGSGLSVEPYRPSKAVSPRRVALPWSEPACDWITSVIPLQAGGHLHVVADLEPEGNRSSFACPSLTTQQNACLPSRRIAGEREDASVGTLLEKEVCRGVHARPQQAVGLGRSSSVRKVRFAPKTQLVRVTFPFHDPVGKGLHADVPGPARLDPWESPFPGHPRRCGPYRCGRRPGAVWRSWCWPAGRNPRGFTFRSVTTPAYGARICVYWRMVFTRDRSASAFPWRARATASLAFAFAKSA
jgi:hypothetical protein